MLKHRALTWRGLAEGMAALELCYCGALHLSLVTFSPASTEVLQIHPFQSQGFSSLPWTHPTYLRHLKVQLQPKTRWDDSGPWLLSPPLAPLQDGLGAGREKHWTSRNSGAGRRGGFIPPSPNLQLYLWGRAKLHDGQELSWDPPLRLCTRHRGNAAGRKCMQQAQGHAGHATNPPAKFSFLFTNIYFFFFPCFWQPELSVLHDWRAAACYRTRTKAAWGRRAVPTPPGDPGLFMLIQKHRQFMHVVHHSWASCRPEAGQGEGSLQGPGAGGSRGGSASPCSVRKDQRGGCGAWVSPWGTLEPLPTQIEAWGALCHSCWWASRSTLRSCSGAGKVCALPSRCRKCVGLVH